MKLIILLFTVFNLKLIIPYLSELEQLLKCVFSIIVHTRKNRKPKLFWIGDICIGTFKYRPSSESLQLYEKKKRKYQLKKCKNG